MALIRCRQCGREYEEMPASCFCGNSNPVMWEIFPGAGNGQQPGDDAPQPSAGNTWQQQMNAVGQPANSGWQQQTGGWQQPQTPDAPPAAYTPPQPQENGGGKGKKTALIILIVLLSAALLAVGGYVVWQQFFSDPAASSSEDDEEDGDEQKSRDKEKNTEAPSAGTTTESPAQTTAEQTTEPTTERPTEPETEPVTEPDDETLTWDIRFHGISVTVPQAFNREYADEDYQAFTYKGDRAYVELSLEEDGDYQEFLDEYDSEEAYAEEMMSYLTGMDKENLSVSECSHQIYAGHDVVNVRYKSGNQEVLVYLIFTDDGMVWTAFMVDDINDTEALEMLNIAASSIVIL